jgi:lipopolysaccharide export system protein LptA
MKSRSPTARLVAAVVLALAPFALHAEDIPTVITSEGEGQMISTDTETTITFRNKVLVTGTDLKLNCDFLQVIVRRKGDATATIGKIDKFRSMLATGNVLLVQGDREAACGRAEVLPDQERVILTENPVVVDRDQKTRIAGEKITLLRGQRQVLVEKPILTGPPVKDLGFDKDKKPATPPAAGTTPP